MLHTMVSKEPAVCWGKRPKPLKPQADLGSPDIAVGWDTPAEDTALQKETL